MADLGSFDAHEVEPAGDYTPLPAGKYEAVIVDSVMKPTRAGTGRFLQLTFQITKGEYTNRLVWTRLNLDNPNAKAVEIARGELSAICRAVGVMAPSDSAQLHNLPMLISVTCKKRDDTGEITNEIRGFSRLPVHSAVDGGGDDDVPPWSRGS